MQIQAKLEKQDADQKQVSLESDTRRERMQVGIKFTCFTSLQVQILTPQGMLSLSLSLSLYIYIYIYIVYVCVCVLCSATWRQRRQT